MRLRLRIERNALPPTQALWPVKDCKCTIAQLLQHINDIFPLESDTWDLEDYSVSVGGYECLHYHEVEAVCKEDDELVIKALQWADVRSRTLTGRAQISQDGRHLVDGVPFGRPCLKAPVRPELSIPPRKKRRLLQSEDAQESRQLLLMEHSEDDEDDDEEEEEEEDYDFESEASDTASSSTASSSSDSSEEDSEDSESDSSDTSSADSSGTSLIENLEPGSFGPFEEEPNTEDSGKTSGKHVSGANLVPADTTGTALAPGSGEKRKRNVNDGENSQDQDSEIAAIDANGSLPREGTSVTRARNARRRDTKRLKSLKQRDILPANASLDDLRQWQQSTPQWNTFFEKPSEDPSTTSGTTKMVFHDGAMEADAVDTEHKAIHPDNIGQKRKKPNAERHHLENFEHKRQKLLSALHSGGIDVTENYTAQVPAQDHNESPPAQPPVDQQTAVMAPFAIIEAIEAIDEVSAVIPLPQAPRRSQLDLAGSKRLLFGSLGVRVPKTQEERDRVQKKLAERPKRNAGSLEDEGPEAGVAQGNDKPEDGAAQETDPATAGAEEDPDAWKERVHLTAVECCEEGITLSTPPFPFVQRWDPQQRKRKAKQRSSNGYTDGGSRKRKKAKTNNHYETYDKYNVNGNGDALNYDDVEVDDEYWEDGALLKDDYYSDEDEARDDGFPALPDDSGALQTLLHKDAKVDDFIAYVELACDASTEWQPKMVTRAAKIVRKPEDDAVDSYLTLQLSSRDRKPKVFDEEGNRVYSKFEMPEDDEAADDGIKEVRWNELGEVKLLLKAAEGG